jgi:hypothetical protein
VRVSYDPQLVEETVHRLASEDPERWRVYRRRIDPLYERADRDAALAAAMLDLFRRWGPARWCEEALALIEGVDGALVARPRRPGDEGADLLVGAHRTVLVRLDGERLLEPQALRVFLRHELRHVADMLDPSFGYRPDLGAPGRTRAEKELVRSRYRVLWNLAIDAVEASPVPPAARRRETERAFAALDAEQRARLMARFGDPALRTHARLVAAARDPWAFLGEPRRPGCAPGQPCPLCGFPTYDWSDDPPGDAIRADFAAWEPAHGACRQCCDLYRATLAP